ncbi:hypothetical protein BSM4216_0957 [Bacillus smithii]|nr:hypothetical protein BSM4216_0957 [Bacillus smithii]
MLHGLLFTAVKNSLEQMKSVWQKHVTKKKWNQVIKADLKSFMD